MSALGVNSNFIGAESKKVPKSMNGDIDGYSDPRRIESGQGKRKNKWNNNSNTNGTHRTNRSNASNGPGSNTNGVFHNNNSSSGKTSRKPRKEESPITDDYLDIPTKTISRQAPERLQDYSPTEIHLTGPLFPNPELFGFHALSQKQMQNRPIPKYLIHQSRLLYTPQFLPNTWDKQNQEKLLQLEQSISGNDYQGMYEEFQRLREVERKKMEDLGLVDAENIRKDLNDAISFQGSCEDMCPIFERVRRSLENNVKALEKDQNTNKISRERAIKAFSRPAAGQPPPLPSEVRPPHILQQTLNYLVDNIVEKLPESHSFLWDRTRSIRQDFTYQNSFGPEAIDCNERIVRIHLISLHVMAKSGQEYSQQQELEQFNKALQTLIEIYQDIRNHGGGDSPNEAEFRSYYLISHFRNPELEFEIQSLPNHLFKDPQIQLALRLRNIISQNNLIERGGLKNSPGSLNLFVEFFRLVYSNQTPFLMSCLLETHFNEIRFYALKSMTRSYHTKGKPYLAENLKTLLGFDTVEMCVKFVTYYEVDIIHENGEILVDLFNKEKLESKYKLNSIHEKPKLSQPLSHYIDQKTIGRTLKDFINMGKPNTSFNLKTLPNVTLPPVSIPKPNSSSSLPVPQNTGFGSSTTFGNVGAFGQGIAPAPHKVPSTNFSQPLPSSNKNAPSLKSVNTGFGMAISSTFGQQNTTSGEPGSGFGGLEKLPNNSGYNNSSEVPTQVGLFAATPKFRTDPVSSTAANTKASNSTDSFSFPQKSPAPFNIPKIREIKEADQSDIQEKYEPKPSQPIPKISIPQPIPPKQKKMSELPNYSRAVDELLTDLMKNCINTELSSLLPKLIKFQNLKHERANVIDSLSKELYGAFLSEIIYKTSMEGYADWIFQQKLKKSIIRKIKLNGLICIQKQHVKKKKIDELNSISFKVPKRRLSSVGGSENSSFISLKRRNFRGASSANDSYIDERQSEIKKLWSPLDLNNFISICSENLKVPIESKQLEVLFLLVVENWTSSYSKWLNTKLSLHTNVEQRIYENKLVNDKLNIDFRSLPGNNYLTKDFFSSTSFVLFECGCTDNDSNKVDGVSEKLNKDGRTLKKIVSLIDKFSYYKVQILIVFWDVTGAKLSFERVCNILNLQDLSKTSENIENIILCDMTSEDNNIHDILSNGFDKVRDNFRGELSKRGIKKRAKLQKLEAINERVENKECKIEPLSNETFKSEESALIKKAKQARKYDYLKNHVGGYTSDFKSLVDLRNGNGDTSFVSRLANNSVIGKLNTSGIHANSHFARVPSNLGGANTSINRTVNSSLFVVGHNRSIIPHLTSIHKSSNRNNSVLSSANSTINSSINNISTLTGFGNGVLEESTPSSSPGPKLSLANLNKKPLPKSVQQLRDLTAGIKARYRKN